MYIFIGSPAQQQADKAYNQACILSEQGQDQTAYELFKQSLALYEEGHANILRHLAARTRSLSFSNLLYENAFALGEIALTKTRLLQTRFESTDDFLAIHKDRSEILSSIKEAQQILIGLTTKAALQLKEKLLALEKELLLDEINSITTLGALSSDEDENSEQLIGLLPFLERLEELRDKVAFESFVKAQAILHEKVSEGFMLQGEQCTTEQKPAEECINSFHRAKQHIKASIDCYTKANLPKECIALHLSFLFACEQQALISGDSTYSVELIQHIQNHRLLECITTIELRMELLDGLLKASRSTPQLSNEQVVRHARELLTLCQDIETLQSEFFEFDRPQITNYRTLALLVLQSRNVQTIPPNSPERQEVEPMELQQVLAQKTHKRLACEIASQSATTASPTSDTRLLATQDFRMFKRVNASQEELPLPTIDRALKMFDTFLSSVKLSKKSLARFLSISADAWHPQCFDTSQQPGFYQKKISPLQATYYKLALLIAHGSSYYASINKASGRFTSTMSKQSETIFKHTTLSPTINLSTHEGIKLFLEKQIQDILDEIASWSESNAEIQHLQLHYLNYLSNHLHLAFIPSPELTRLLTDLASLTSNLVPSEFRLEM